jgi:hypothetical protein
VIEASGSTKLERIGTAFYLDAVGSSAGTGPTLKYAGVDFYTGQIGGWTPIGVEKTAGGYVVAWKVAGSDQYTIWNADNSGNYVSSVVGVVSGSNAAFEAQETIFQQDLNSDGIIGVPSGALPAPAAMAGSSLDAFVFRNDLTTAVNAATGAAGDLQHLDQLAPVAGNGFAWPSSDGPGASIPQGLQLASLLGESTHDQGHQGDSVAAPDFRWTDLHASHFVL